MPDGQTLGRPKQHRLLAELSPVGIFRTDAQGECRYVNPQLCRLTGLSARQARGKGWASSVHPADLDRVWKLWQDSVREGTPLHSEHRLRRPDGTEGWVLCQAVPTHDQSGAVVGFVGTVTDITRQKQAEDELRRSEQRYHALAECAGVGISHLTLEGSTLYLNTALRSMLELDQDEDVQGLHFTQFFTPDSSVRIAAELRNRVSGRVSSYPAQLMGRHGTRRDVMISGAPVRGPDGQIESAIGTIIDITDRLRAEEAARQARNELETRVVERTADLERAAESNKRLLLEVDHRVRNNLAGLLSVLALTRANARDVESFGEAIEGRLVAIAQVHEALAATGWRAVGLRPMLESLLGALRRTCRHSSELLLGGPEVNLSSRQALPLMMVVQEWFTNSCKYGALSVAGGLVRIEWQLEVAHGPAQVEFRWSEIGGPRVEQPVRPSLGTDLVRAFITRELRGECHINYPPAGADHVVRFPAESPANAP